MKLKLTLDPETVRLLRLEAFGRDCSLSAVVTELVRSTPRRFVLTDRGAKGSQAPEVTAQGQDQRVSGARGESGPLGLLSSTG